MKKVFVMLIAGAVLSGVAAYSASVARPVVQARSE
jgi:hypothetical protein